MQTLVMERSIWVSATRERIWAAINTPEQLVQWFAPALPGAVLQSDDGGKITVHFGPMGFDFAKLDVIAPMRQVSMCSLPDQLLTATYTLEEEKGGTQVQVSLSGFERLPQASQEDRIRLSKAACDKTLQNLKAYLDGNELPFPQTHTGPLFGQWTQPDGLTAIERSIWINAAPARVWETIVDPKQIQIWFSPNTPWQRTAEQVGGRLFVLNAETNAEQYVEVIEQLDKPHKLVTRCLPEAPDTVVKYRTYTLQEEKGGTQVFLTLAGYDAEPEETRWGHMEQDSSGFGLMLGNIKAHIEGTDLPWPMGF